MRARRGKARETIFGNLNGAFVVLMSYAITTWFVRLKCLKISSKAGWPAVNVTARQNPMGRRLSMETRKKYNSSYSRTSMMPLLR